jgi:RHS repeat-associated protein
MLAAAATTTGTRSPGGVSGGAAIIHRYYDPDIGRYITADPVMQLARGWSQPIFSYAMNDPFRFFDRSGLSAQDVQAMERIFHDVVDELTTEGLRTDPGWWNNLLTLCGADYWGCGAQASYLKKRLETERILGSFDDYWDFYIGASLVHRWTEAKSANKCDPLVIMDPWNNSFATRK